VTKRCGDEIGNEDVFISYPATRNKLYGSSVTGGYLNFAFNNLVPSVLDTTGKPAHVKESERSLNQRRNCRLSNAGTGYDFRKKRWTDHQYHSRGSVAVVVGGVATTQGDGSTVYRAKGHSHVEYLDTVADGSRLYHPKGCSTLPLMMIRLTLEGKIMRGRTPDALKGACPVWEGLHQDRLV